MKKLSFLGLLLLTSHIFAQSAATVLFTAKTVVVSHNGVERSLKRGSALDVGDEIRTSAEALANIQYSNGALVRLGSSTKYKILAYAPKESVQIKAELNEGKIEIKTTEQIKESLKTPILSLAILGTDVLVYVASPRETYIQVIQGLVLARNEYLRPGDSVRVTANNIERAPFPKEGIVPTRASETTPSTTSAAVSGADSVTQVTTAQEVGTTTIAATQATQIVSLANISCSP